MATKTSNERRADELEEIFEELGEILHRAEALVRGTTEEYRADAYWLAQMKIALSNDHQFLGGAGHTLRDTIDALRRGDDTDGEG